MASSSEAIYGDNPLTDGVLPYDASKDEDGSEVVATRLPGRVIRYVEDLLSLRQVPMRNRSDLLRAAIFHYLKHAAQLTDNPDLVMEWVAIEEASRAARWESQRAQDAKVIEDLASSIRASLEDYDLDMIAHTLSRFFEPLMRLPEDHPRRHAFLRLARAHPNVWRAVQDARKRSIMVQDVFEIMSKLND